MCKQVSSGSIKKISAKYSFTNYIFNRYRETIDNKVIQAEGEIHLEIKSTLFRFGSNEPSSRLGRMIFNDVKQTMVV